MKSLYETSAILSAHIESATIPLRLALDLTSFYSHVLPPYIRRLKHRADDLSSLCDHLNWPQNTRFSNLSGIFPFVDGDDLYAHLHDFSEVVEPVSYQILSQLYLDHDC